MVNKVFSLLLTVVILSVASVQAANPRFRARDDGFVEVDAPGFVVDGQDLLADARSFAKMNSFYGNFFSDLEFTNSSTVLSTDWSTKLYAGPQDGLLEWARIGTSVFAQLTVTMTTSEAGRVFNLRLPVSALAPAGVPVAEGRGTLFAGGESLVYPTNITVDSVEFAIDGAHCCTKNAREWVFGFMYPTGSKMWEPAGGSTSTVVHSGGNVGIGDFSGGPPADSLHIQSGGIRFGAGLNSLSAYEEGTFLPELTGSSGAYSAISYGERSGTFVRIGRVVTFSLVAEWPAITGGTGVFEVRGLPYSATQKSYFTVGGINLAWPSVGTPQAYLHAGSANLRFHVIDSDNTNTVQASIASSGTPNKYVWVSGSYITD